jgi:hypothetical protein
MSITSLKKKPRDKLGRLLDLTTGKIPPIRTSGVPSLIGEIVVEVEIGTESEKNHDIIGVSVLSKRNRSATGSDVPSLFTAIVKKRSVRSNILVDLHKAEDSIGENHLVRDFHVGSSID